MKIRLLAVMLALPLAAFDCGGKDETTDPVGLGCRVHVGGAVPAEDLWCIVAAFDYSSLDPEFASSDWVFEIVAYRGMEEIGAGAGLFLEGRPTLGTVYGWDGDVATSTLTSGEAERYAPVTMQITHSAYSLGNGGLGEGKLSVSFSQIPPANAVDGEVLGVHGSLTAELPPLMIGGGTATLSATF